MNYSPSGRLRKKDEINSGPTSQRRTSPRLHTKKNLDLPTPPSQHHLPASSYLQHAVFRSAFEGKTRIVLEMLEREPRLIDEIGELSNGTTYAPSTILHFACRAGHINLANELVKVSFIRIHHFEVNQ